MYWMRLLGCNWHCLKEPCSEGLIGPAFLLVGYDTFLADFSSWLLNFSEKTPCIWVKALDLVTQSDVQIVENLQVAARANGWLNCIVFVFVEGEVERLQAHLSSTLPLVCDDWCGRTATS